MEYLLSGEIKPFEGADLFRKWTNTHELEICTILKPHPHRNICSVHDVTDAYVDLELLEPISKITSQVIADMMSAKQHLQSLGIAYIDWKCDNVGFDKFGVAKVFDFDGCGLFKGDAWVVEPPEYYAYRNAPKIHPRKIDEWCFGTYFLND